MADSQSQQPPVVSLCVREDFSLRNVKQTRCWRRERLAPRGKTTRFPMTWTPSVSPTATCLATPTSRTRSARRLRSRGAPLRRETRPRHRLTDTRRVGVRRACTPRSLPVRNACRIRPITFAIPPVLPNAASTLLKDCAARVRAYVPHMCALRIAATKATRNTNRRGLQGRIRRVVSA